MSRKDKSLIKLVLWAGLLTWSLFYIALGATISIRVPILIRGVGLFPDILRFVAPVWVIFTTVLTVLLIFRYTSRRLLK